VEAVGKVAQAIEHLEAAPQCRRRRNHLIDEVVHVAAVAVAWLETFEVKPNAPDQCQTRNL
jgi:hypothetical protein